MENVEVNELRMPRREQISFVANAIIYENKLSAALLSRDKSYPAWKMEWPSRRVAKKKDAGELRVGTGLLVQRIQYDGGGLGDDTEPLATATQLQLQLQLWRDVPSSILYLLPPRFIVDTSHRQAA